MDYEKLYKAYYLQVSGDRKNGKEATEGAA